MLTFYLLVLIVLLMIAYAGFEGTMRVFAYLDLQLRFLVVKIRMYFMGLKLRRQLIRIREELDAESKRHKD